MLLQNFAQNIKYVQTWILLILTLQFGATHAVSTHGTIRGRSQFQFPCPIAIFGPSGWNVKDRTAEAIKLQRFCTFDRNLTRLLRWQIFTKFSFQVIKHLQQVSVGLERIIAGEPAPLFMVPFLKPASFGILIFSAQLLRFKSQIPSETGNLRQGTMSRSRSPEATKGQCEDMLRYIVFDNLFLECIMLNVLQNRNYVSFIFHSKTILWWNSRREFLHRVSSKLIQGTGAMLR